jgi:hypothetical protein
VLHAAPLVRREAVEAGCDEGLQRFGYLERLELASQAIAIALTHKQSAVEEHAHGLDGVERHSLRAPQNALPKLLGKPWHGTREEDFHCLARQRLEEDRGEVPLARSPARAAVLRLRSGEGEYEERHVTGPLDEVLDEVEQCAVGPVDVLEDEYGGPRLREPLEEHARGREQVLLIAHGAFFESEQVCEARFGEAALLSVGDVLVDGAAELFACGLGILVLDDPGAAANHLGKRPERDPVPVRQAAAGVPPHAPDEPVDVLLELPREA